MSVYNLKFSPRSAGLPQLESLLLEACPRLPPVLAIELILHLVHDLVNHLDLQHVLDVCPADCALGLLLPPLLYAMLAEGVAAVDGDSVHEDL